MTLFPCWLPGEEARREVLASCPSDAAETFAAAMCVLRGEGDELDVYVGASEALADSYRVKIIGGDVVAALIGQRLLRKAGAR